MTYSNQKFNFIKQKNMSNLQRDFSPKDYSHFEKEEEQMRKRIYLDSIQQQMIKRQDNQYKSKQDKYYNDQKYLQSLQSNYPFGRGGAGAPNRDKEGNIITTRRRLISDPKYQHYNIYVNDDYNDVWNLPKPGVMRFVNERATPYNQAMTAMSSMNNQSTVVNNDNYGHGGFVKGENLSDHRYTSAKRLGNIGSSVVNNRVNPYGNDMNHMNFYNEQANNNHLPNDYHPQYNNTSHLNHINSTNDINNNMNMNYNTYPTYPNTNTNQIPYKIDNQHMKNSQINEYDHINQQDYMSNNDNWNQLQNNTDQKGNLDISISYNNTELNVPDNDHIKKSKLRGYLENQINEKKERKKREEERRRREEFEEEERLKKEREALERRLKEEEEYKKKQKEEIDLENQKLRDKAFNQLRPSSRKVKFDDFYGNTEDNQVVNEKPEIVIDAFDPKHDERIKKELNEQIIRLRNQINEQQQQVINQIIDLKAETQQANLQRYDALREIAYLKEEIGKNRIEDELRRKYVYDVMVGSGSSGTGMTYESKKEEVLPIYNKERGLNLSKLKENDMRNMYYDDHIRKPQENLKAPIKIVDDEVELRCKSDYIDVNSHRLDGKETYLNTKVRERKKEEERKPDFSMGIKANNDFYIPEITYEEYDKQISKRLVEYNKDREEDYKEINEFKYPNEKRNDGSKISKVEKEYNNKDINEVYNKNLERLRWLNSLEA